MAENLTPKKYIDSSNMKQILTAVKNEISSDNGIITTEAEYLALPEEQKLNNSYYLYDIGVHYKNGVAYSRKKPIQLTMEEYKALGEVDPDQEYIVSTDEQGILLGAEDIGYSNAVSNLPCTTVQGAIDKVNANLDEKVDYKVVVENGTRYVEDIVVQDINTWLPNDNSSIVINLKKANGANYSNFQLLCNKKDSKNWSCIVNGVANELWKIRYIDGVRYIDELATMDKLGGCSIIKGTTTLTTNQSGAMTLSHGGNFDHCTVSIQPTNNNPYFFSYCPLSKTSTYIIVIDWHGEIVTNTTIEFNWTLIGW